jgi:hypothetical protein
MPELTPQQEREYVFNSWIKVSVHGDAWPIIWSTGAGKAGMEVATHGATIGG